MITVTSCNKDDNAPQPNSGVTSKSNQNNSDVTIIATWQYNSLYRHFIGVPPTPDNTETIPQSGVTVTYNQDGTCTQNTGGTYTLVGDVLTQVLYGGNVIRTLEVLELTNNTLVLKELVSNATGSGYNIHYYTKVN